MIPILPDTLNLMDPERDYQELLRELGWLPADLSCPEKKRLADGYLAADAAWRNTGKDLVAEMRDRFRSGYQAREILDVNKRFTAVRPAMEEARLEAARARLALEAHVAEHGC